MALRPGQDGIRALRAADYGRVVALWRASEGIVLREVDGRPAIARYLRRNPGTSFVFEAAGEIVGAVLCGTDGRRGFLHHLAVARGHRREGIGAALVERALAALSRIGIDKCHLLVLPANTAARRFWKRVGWVERDDVVLMSHTASGKPEA
ncbi:MAG TPA: GNAT family N-acetyltransferase [Anaeromyxobacteraceae bacterium]|nr:GNAT family N-acetyltransferase [Anaeromyxobacteraceae bacterium]